MSRNTLRFEIIGRLVEGKSVLDVGCVDHEALRADRPEWLHAFIAERASHVIGLDMAAAEAETLNRRGYKIRIGNAETVELDEKFDCIVGGEIIEHLDNPGLFLNNMYCHLRPGGSIILTTPNPFYPLRQVEILLHGRVAVHPEHTLWYCPQTLAYALRRAGFTNIEVRPFSNSEAFFRLGRLPGNLRPWFATNLLATGQRPDDL
jgi:2-polyprenyl-3-methyl-5-hydroxy-6-metoxy-1,4-benzoquinol methylase